jgi:hypothetical protein
MTENPSAAGREAFQKSLLECVQDINDMLPGLSRRYDMTVIIGGLAEHVGAALQVLIRKNICDVRQAGLVIEQIEGSALLRKGAQPRVKGSRSGARPAPGTPAAGGPARENPTRY